MSCNDKIVIEADDCHPFKNQKGHDEAIRYFIENAEKWNLFHFNPNYQNDEDDAIISFNYRDAQWYAGRYVGEATFAFDGQLYLIRINPRFGMLHLFRMLEEVFNVRFSSMKNQYSREKELQFFIKKLVSFLWLHLLAKANKHGLPRHNVNREHKGSTVRGRINVRKSILPMVIEEKLVSNYREKALNETVTHILKKAYKSLLNEYHLGTINIPANAKDAITNFEGFGIQDRHVPDKEYQRIIYKDIYQSFKPVVDLSWDIIRGKSVANNLKQEQKDSFSFFIDMAEIWELYLKTLLKRHFSKEGWSIKKEKIITYKGKIFQRELIPDIVLQREEELLVFDAKYKLMQFRPFDIDRGDFFQIHTYIHCLNDEKKVLAGGLLYPLSNPYNEGVYQKTVSKTLFGNALGYRTAFFLDGIDLSGLIVKNESEVDCSTQLSARENEFLERLKKYYVN